MATEDRVIISVRTGLIYSPSSGSQPTGVVVTTTYAVNK